ncbi:MAG TPA: hypothetical protein VGC46_05330 [Allosphingosinicella sp.]
MSLHTLFGRHVVDAPYSHWEGGHFVSRCTVCGREMVKLPGMPWGLSGRR